MGIYADEASLEDGWKKQIIFPLSKTVQDSRRLHQQQVRVLQRPDGEQGGLRPGRERVQGHRLRPYPGLLLRTAPSAAGQDQRRQDDRCPGGRRPAGTDRRVRQEPGLHRHRVTRGRFALDHPSGPGANGCNPRAGHHSKESADDSRHSRRHAIAAEPANGPSGLDQAAQPQRTEEGPDRVALRRPVRHRLPRLPDRCPWSTRSTSACSARASPPASSFAGVDNYVKAFTDPSFLAGSWFVIRFAVVLIPVQMVVSLAVALVLDALTTRFARFARLMIFLPYAIPAVIGALMWGFLYSPTFGPMQQLANIFGAQRAVPAQPRPHLRRPAQRRHLAVGRLLHDHHLRGAAGHRLLASTRRPGSTARTHGRSPSGSRSR